MEEKAPLQVYLFEGLLGQGVQAAFSTKQHADAWIKQHQICGILSEVVLDDPAVDRSIREGKPPKVGKRQHRIMHERVAEWYPTNEMHWHYFFGLGEDDDGFDEANDRAIEEQEILGRRRNGEQGAGDE